MPDTASSRRTADAACSETAGSLPSPPSLRKTERAIRLSERLFMSVKISFIGLACATASVCAPSGVSAMPIPSEIRPPPSSQWLVKLCRISSSSANIRTPTGLPKQLSGILPRNFSVLSEKDARISFLTEGQAAWEAVIFKLFWAKICGKGGSVRMSVLPAALRSARTITIPADSIVGLGGVINGEPLSASKWSGLPTSPHRLWSSIRCPVILSMPCSRNCF
ncbi:Uncharacterised protein [Neisseria meningitidis]|nr:Uncharacterised protein [Neisseria meningitidis]CWP70413.1 Uncharacterised protein [Neisseria meningitidis]CWT60037.1 Uncharacterised protein [Neisseria meningitidis]